MTAKKYLYAIQNHRRILKALARRKEELRVQAEGVRAIIYKSDRVQVSPSNKLEQIVPLLIAAEEEYAQELASYHVDLVKRISQIGSMEREDHAEVLYLRYVETAECDRQLSMMEVADRMNRSYDRTKHLHGEALAAFEKKYLKNKR